MKLRKLAEYKTKYTMYSILQGVLNDFQKNNEFYFIGVVRSLIHFFVTSKEGLIWATNDLGTSTNNLRVVRGHDGNKIVIIR